MCDPLPGLLSGGKQVFQAATYPYASVIKDALCCDYLGGTGAGPPGPGWSHGCGSLSMVPPSHRHVAVIPEGTDRL